MRLARGIYRDRVVALASTAGVSPVRQWAVLPGLDRIPADDPVLDLLRAGEQDPSLLAQQLEHRLAIAAAEQVTVLAPLHRPGKMIAVGLNYADHTAETGMTAPTQPLTFAKYPTSIVGDRATIRVPAAVTEQPDWEAELAVVIGRSCGPHRSGTLEDVVAYTVANDVSARDLQRSETQWSRAKSIDTFCPLGPELVTADEFGHPSGHRVWCTVNGATMQEASTDDMIFDVAAILAFLTTTMTLEAGDVILTGTPPGVGGFRTPPVFLGDGDVVEVGVEGIGTLHNEVEWFR